jgi:hypothetical protein
VHKHFYENWRAKFPKKPYPKDKLWALFGCFSYDFVESATERIFEYEPQTDAPRFGDFDYLKCSECRDQSRQREWIRAQEIRS